MNGSHHTHNPPLRTATMSRHGHYHYQRVHHTSTASTSTCQGPRQWPTALITHITTPPPEQPPYQTMVTTIANASTHTIARSNGARFEPQIMYVCFSFFSSFFSRLLMIFLHLDYMYRVDDSNERPPHHTHTILSRDSHHIIPCTITLHHGTTIVNVSTPTRKLTKKKNGNPDPCLGYGYLTVSFTLVNCLNNYKI